MGHISRKMEHQNTHQSSFMSVPTTGFHKATHILMVSFNSLRQTIIMSEDWRKEMERFTSNKHQLKLLREGPKSLSQAMMLQALKVKYNKIMHIDE
jgi:hypothetical protein